MLVCPNPPARLLDMDKVGSEIFLSYKYYKILEFSFILISSFPKSNVSIFLLVSLKFLKRQYGKFYWWRKPKYPEKNHS